jgi:hypothetical protein
LIGGAVAAALLAGGVALATRGGGSSTLKAAADTGSTTTVAATTAPVTSTPVPTTAQPTTTPVPTTAAPTTPAPTVAPTVPAPTVAPVATREVADSTGSFAVTLPAAMATNTASLTLGGIAFAHVSGSTDLTGYLAGNWGTDGVSVLATDSASVTPSQAAAALRPAACTVTSGEQPYTTPNGSGVLVEYDSCGGGTWAESIIAVEVPAAHALVLIGGTGQGPANAGLTAELEAILASVRPL